MEWSDAKSSCTRGELQGFYCHLLLHPQGRAVERAEIQRIASQRRIWLPETPEQARGLLFGSGTPIRGREDR